MFYNFLEFLEWTKIYDFLGGGGNSSSLQKKSSLPHQNKYSIIISYCLHNKYNTHNVDFEIFIFIKTCKILLKTGI